MRQLEILKQLMTIFDSEQLTYFAIGGTALGAVRHNGFIPWDDDIDIAMPRPDYERFLKLQSKLPANLFIQHHSTEKGYPLYFVKVREKGTIYMERRLAKYDIEHGVFVDIFAWDELGEPGTVDKVLARKIHKFKRTVVCNRYSVFNFMKTYFYRMIYGFKSPDALFRELDEYKMRHNGSKTGRLGCVEYNDILDEDDLFPLRLHQFEDTRIYLPNNVDKYLKDKYGDYMKMPDEKDRLTHRPVKVALP
ncbi:MAG TPA: LicD family protein [Gammaproteobacteria bacterium]|nr:LicD family protein [Gammaproteobacteria bacterium]